MILVCLFISCSIALPIAEKEFTFFVSVLLHSFSLHSGAIEIFTSHLICPFSISASETWQALIIFWSSFKNSITSSLSWKTGSVTISIRGLQALLKSQRVFHPAWISFQASFSKCIWSIANSFISPFTIVFTAPFQTIGSYICVIW